MIRVASADVRPAQCSEFAGRHRRRRGDRLGRRRDPHRLRRFKGVKRRFTKTGEWSGVTVIDDYGHHPVEIAAVLRAARGATTASIIAVVQPHRYTRLHSLRRVLHLLQRCRRGAGRRRLCRRRAADRGRHRDALVAGLRARGHRKRAAPAGPDQLATMVGRWPSRATSSSASAPARSPTGRTACLASSTSWAAEAPHDGGAAGAAERLIERLPPVRGRLTENVPLAPTPGSASAAPPRSCSAPPISMTSPAFSRQARRRAGDGDRRRLEPAGARRRCRRRRDPARPRLRRYRIDGAMSRPAPVRSISTSRWLAARPASPGSNS